jgi:CDP-diacylglycerol--serine O-phosphatidyltransferase
MKSRKRRIGIYWLPNLFTLTALACGMYAVVLSTQGKYIDACLFLIAAGVFDVLDGFVAKLTNSTSEFGAQLDSLSDMVSFGVAPAFLAWSWSYEALGKDASMVFFIFTAMTALRLSRFNTQIADKEKKMYFQGLPSPAGAMAVFSLVWLAETYSLHQSYMSWVLLITSVMIALLMVSNIRYPGIKHLGREKIPFVGLLALLLIFVVIVSQPALILTIGSIGYALFGIIYTLFLRRQRRIERKLKNSNNHKQYVE